MKRVRKLRLLRLASPFALLALWGCGPQTSDPASGRAPLSAAEVEAEIVAYWRQAKPRENYGAWHRHGQALARAIPELLRSRDRHVVHEGLLLARDRVSVPEAMPHVIAALERLLADPVRVEGGTRRLACAVLGKYACREAVPVLLAALADPHVHFQRAAVPGAGGTDVQWFAVWRDADEALRGITGASPFESPEMREPPPGLQKSLIAAWTRWSEEQK